MNKKDSYRKLKILNYRNIGINKDKKPFSFLLNPSFDEGKKGSLSIIIGPNNSGKTNILNAINSFNENFTDDDKTNLSFEDSPIKISLECNEYIYEKLENDEINIKNFELEKLIKSILDKFEEVFKKKYIGFDESYYKKDTFKLENDIGNIMDLCENFMDDFEKNPHSQLKELNDMCKHLISYCESKEPNVRINLIDNDLLENINGYSMSLTIGNNLNDFYKSIFHLINYDYNELIKASEIAARQNNKALLLKIQKELNSKLKKINKDFNLMYSFDSDFYKFEFSIETNKIHFLIWKNNIPLSYDLQSIGFKWFFSLYFSNVLKNLKPGDILLFDEPGVHLHINGQRELRNFLKKLALDNGITIVISTHSPFLISLDNLDEIRLVENDESGSLQVNNKFHLIGDKSTDILDNIKKALTINNNILFEEGSKLIFVEGITDYNYLTGMKLKLENYKNLYFIPINGLGKNDKEQQEKIAALVRIWNQNPILLIDSDKVAKEFSNKAKNTALKTISLDEIDSTFLDYKIEDLFDKKDIETIGEKSFENSSTFKNFIDQYNISEKTKNNFKKVLDYLENI